MGYGGTTKLLKLTVHRNKLRIICTEFGDTLLLSVWQFLHSRFTPAGAYLSNIDIYFSFTRVSTCIIIVLSLYDVIYRQSLDIN